MDDNLDILKAIYVSSMTGYAIQFVDTDTFVDYIGLEEGETINIDDVSYDFITNYLLLHLFRLLQINLYNNLFFR